MKKFKLMGVLVFAMALAFTICSYVKVNAEVAGPGTFEGFTALKIPQGTTAKRGEKVYVKLYADVNKIDSIQLVLGSEMNRDAFMVELYDIKNSNLGGHDPYFIMPDSVTEGDTIALLDVLVRRGTIYESYSTSQSTNGGSAYMNVGEEKYITISKSNKIQLHYIDFKTREMTVPNEDKAYININYTGEVRDTAATVYLTNVDTLVTFNAPIEDLYTNPYIWLPTEHLPITAGTYRITEVRLGDPNYEITAFGDHNNAANFLSLPGDSLFGGSLVIKDLRPSIKLKQFNISEEIVKIGETLNVGFSTDRKIESAMLSLYNETANDSMTVYLKASGSIDHYTFVVPSTAKEGKYVIENLILKGTNGETASLTVNDSKFLNDYITVKKEIVNTKTVVFNNDSYNNTVMNNIRLSDDNAVITVTADTNSIIAKEIFEAIANTKRTLIVQYKNSEWVFNGIDIKNPKDIDASMLISEISSEDFYESKVAAGIGDNTMLLKFADNGNLPGKVLIRLKSEKLDSIFKGESIFVYYYDKDVDSLYKVATEVHKTDGYYEFYINHNSSYVLSAKKIDDTYVSEDTNKLDLNKDLKSSTKTTGKTKEKKDSDDTYKIVAGVLAGVVIVLAGALVIPKVVKKKNKVSE